MVQHPLNGLLNAAECTVCFFDTEKKITLWLVVRLCHFRCLCCYAVHIVCHCGKQGMDCFNLNPQNLLHDDESWSYSPDLGVPFQT